jgi:hypothetical protein
MDVELTDHLGYEPHQGPAGSSRGSPMSPPNEPRLAGDALRRPIIKANQWANGRK